MSTAVAEAPAVEDIYLPAPATVLEVKSMTEMEKFFRFQFDDGRPHDYMPGQFMEVTDHGIGEAPISITSTPTVENAGTFDMVIRKVGNVTNALHAMEAGAKVGIRGPFGTTFPVDGTMKGQDLVFICGGIGLVPVRSAIDYVLQRRAEYDKVTILSGTRTPADRLFTDDLEAWMQREDVNFIETVDVADSSWKGNVGVITTLIPQVDIEAGTTQVIVCGPPIMYKFVLLELRKISIPPVNIYLSLERHMKCGVGKCGHCQISGMYACQEGPVFKYSDIVHVKEAI